MAWIHADQAKARKAISVPLNNEAVLVLRRQLGKHQQRVFTYHGKPVIDVNTKAWRHALQRVGIEDFRWHDLRHTWASWHVLNGTHVLQELGLGNRWKWCGVMRILGKAIWPPMLKTCVSLKQSLAQKWHSKVNCNKKGLGKAT